MPRFHIVMNHAMDLDAFEREAAAGQSPRHSVPVMARRLGATLHQACRDAPPSGPFDKVRSKLVGTKESWAFVRQFVPKLGPDDVVYCLDEIVGVPLAATLRGAKRRPKLAVGLVNFDRPRGRLAARLLKFADSVDLFVTCCSTQIKFMREYLKVPEDRTFLSLEHLDNRFFTPGPCPVEKKRPVVVGVGMERRDYKTLAAATFDLDVDVKLSGWSRFAAAAARSLPDPIPANMTRQFYKYPELVQLYREADVVVATIFPAIYAAGVTTLLEGLACRRPVVVTQSPGLSDYLASADGLSVVEPSDPTPMRAAILRLLEHPNEAEAQANKGYESVARRYDFDTYVDTMTRRLEAL